jgi:hypothetical protein
MTGKMKEPACNDESLSDLTRRSFVALSLAAGLGAGTRLEQAHRSVQSGAVIVRTPISENREAPR